MIQIGDKVLFLTVMPVPRKKPQWRWCIGTVQAVQGSIIQIIDNAHTLHTDYICRVKLFQRSNSE